MVALGRQQQNIALDSCRQLSQLDILLIHIHKTIIVERRNTLTNSPSTMCEELAECRVP